MAVKVKDIKAVLLDIGKQINLITSDILLHLTTTPCLQIKSCDVSSGIRHMLIQIITEGTVCQISFVKDVLFPYAMTTLESKVSTLWACPSFQPYLMAFPDTARTDQSTFLEHIRSLMSNDIKDSNLKNLQGYLWLSGYESGSIRCPLFPDVAPMLQKWHDAGLYIFIYSSGSVAAQKLLFQYTQDNSDLRSLITGYFDTINAGPKKLSSSYTHLIAECNIDELKKDAHQWLFFSDRIDEVNAAVIAGMRAIVVTREGNVPISSTDRTHYQVIESLDQVEIL